MSISTANNLFIVLATYNPDLDFLKKQVDSIKAQKYSGWFCLVTDDGSHPEKLKAIVQMLSPDPRFKIIHSEKQIGSVNNFAAGLAHINANANFKYVALCDQDDIWEEAKLASLVEVLEKNLDVVLVHSDLSLIDKDDNLIAQSCWKNEGRKLGNIDFASLIFRNVITGCTVVFRREILTTALPMANLSYPAPYHHDVWLSLHALCWGKIHTLNKPLVQYRQHANNVVGAQVETDLFEFFSKFFSWQLLSVKSINAFQVRSKLAKDFVYSLQNNKSREIDGPRFANEISAKVAVFIKPISTLNFIIFCFKIFTFTGFNLRLIQNAIQILFGQFLLLLTVRNSRSEEKNP